MAVGSGFLESLWPSEPERLEWAHALPQKFYPEQETKISHGRLAWSSLLSPELGSNPHHLNSPNTQAKRDSRRGLIGGKGSAGCILKPRVSPPKPPVLSEEKVEEAHPEIQQQKQVSVRSQEWVREHIRITQQHSSSRDPLPDKGKPAVRRGRKATGQVSDLIAGLPDEE
jgi:hypothetical protein